MTDTLNLIGGRWVPSSNGRTYESRNPADLREIVGVFPASTAADALAAVDAASKALPVWSKTTPEKRAQVLDRAADWLAANTRRLAEELTREEGKTLAESTNELTRTTANLRLYAGEALRLRGETFPVESGQLVATIRQPVGVVVAITPWNFPLSIPSRKIGPALAAGNTVVFKPSAVTPLMGHRLVEALLEGGLPPDAIQLVHGAGAEIGDALVSAPKTAAITFTGSFPVGESIWRQAGIGRRTQLEMGGKNPCIVLPDADPDQAAQVALKGAFGLSGQACTGTSRVIAVGSIHDALVERIASGAARIEIGNGLEAGVQMGPLANERQVAKVLDYVEAGRSEGGRLLTGGERLGGQRHERGCFVSPAVFADLPGHSRLKKEEVFGPVLAVERADDIDQAIAMGNDVEYGLAASIVTRDIGRVLDFASRIDAGVVKVNSPTTGVALTAPFGGMKNSSNQVYKEQAGAGVMDFYTFAKTVYLAG